MHTTLTLRTNILLICVWAVILFVCFYVGNSPDLIVVFPFFCIGLLTGIFQFIAIRSTPQLFLATKTALEVRTATLSSTFGKLSIATLWLAVPLLLWLAWSKPELNSPLKTIFGSYAVLAFTREVASIPGVLYLAKLNNLGRQT